MGILIALIGIFLLGIAAILFSMLAARLKNDVYFVISCVCAALILIYLIYNHQWFLSLFQSSASDILFGFVFLSFIVVPAIFLIQAKSKKKPDLDSELTDDAFLDEVIHAPDEEINFEDDLDNHEIDESDFDTL